MGQTMAFCLHLSIRLWCVPQLQQDNCGGFGKFKWEWLPLVFADTLQASMMAFGQIQSNSSQQPDTQGVVHAQCSSQSHLDCNSLRSHCGIIEGWRLKLMHVCLLTLAGLPPGPDSWGQCRPVNKRESHQSCPLSHQQCCPHDPCTRQ